MQRLIGSRIYIDANVFIPFAEGSVEFDMVLRAFFSGVGAGRWVFVTSDLTLAEVMVRPLQLRNEAMIAAYERIMQPRDGFVRLPIDVATLRASAQIRAEYGHRLPDAIHLASALRADCEIFISEDKRLRSVRELQVLRLADLVVEMPPAETS